MHMLLPIFNLLWTEGKGVFNRIWGMNDCTSMMSGDYFWTSP